MQHEAPSAEQIAASVSPDPLQVCPPHEYPGKECQHYKLKNVLFGCQGTLAGLGRRRVHALGLDMVTWLCDITLVCLDAWAAAATPLLGMPA